MTFIVVVRCLAGLIAFTGGFFLWKWLWGGFAQAGLNTITMKTNTALCFLLIGLSMVIQVSLPQRRVINVVRLLAGIVFTIGFLTLLENIFIWDFGIDQILAQEPPGAQGVFYPNRMGIPASTSFVLSSLAILLLTSTKPRIYTVQQLGSVVFLIGLMGVMGYLFGAKPMFGLASLTAIAFPTALLLCSIGVALILRRPYEGFLKEFTTTEIGRQLFTKFLLPACIIAILTGYLRLLGDHLGLYDSATGTGLRTLVFIVTFTWILYFNAKELNARIALQHLTQNTLRFLVDLNAVTQHLTNPNEIMAVTAKMLGEHLDVDRCAYAQVENESIFVITGDYPKNVPSIVGRWPVAAFGRECERLMLANQVYVVVDTDTDLRITPEDLKAYRATTIQAVICVPLHKSGKFTAAMAVHQEIPRNWTPEEIKLVGMVVAKCWESLERSKTIQNLEQLTTVLEDRVAERTKQLEDQAERLRQLAVELTQVEQKERRRLAEVLHDHLQQYLVAAKMRLGVLERKGSMDKQGLQETMSYIDQASNISRQLTAELRPPVLYEGGLSAGLRYLIQKMSERYKLNVNLSVADDTEPSSDSIKVMIYQCVRELLFNIVKYAQVSECWVYVARLENHDIQVTVQDKGIGFNVEDVTASRSNFGLFSIRERVKALGGQLQMTSASQEGSRFTLTIPDQVEILTLQTDGEDSVKGKELVRSKSSKEGIVILVADDHSIMRQSLANLLMAQPFVKEVIEAVNGEEAVRKAETTNPDIILMDINMPLLNGINATQILCSRNPQSKVIGLSVQGEDQMAQMMKDVGAVAYLNKEVDTNTLIDTIKKFASTPNSNAVEHNH